MIDNITENILDNRLKPLKAALFDLDGTLFDTEGQYTIFWGGIGEKYRPDIPTLAQDIKGTTLTQIFERYFPDSALQAQITTELDEWERTMKYEFVPGALDFIKDLKANGVRCAIVTSSNIKKMQSVEAQMPEFATLFDRVLTSEDFSASKPNPDCYLKGASVFDADLDECVVFEDAFTGLEAGTSAGIFTFGIASYNSAEAIKDKCDQVLNNFEGLTLEMVERYRMAKLAPGQLIEQVTDAYLKAIGGALTADNMDTLTADQHSILCYRYILDEVMQGGFIQLILNGYAPYVLEGPFPMVVKKMWEMKDFSKLLYEAKKQYHYHSEELNRDMDEDEFMALYEQLDELNELGDDFLEEHQETVTPLVAKMIVDNWDRYGKE